MMSTTFRTVCVTALAIAIATSSVVAAPNNGKFARSGEAMRLAIAEDCQAAWNFMVDAENRAEKLADQNKMKASREASKEADDWFSYGARKGCGWAA